MYFLNRGILCPHNESVIEINEKVTELFDGEEFISYKEDIPIEFLNTLNIPGLPQHEIVLKRNMPIMLMRNIDKEKGLCNGTRVIVKALLGKYLQVYNPATKEDVCLPRFELIADIKNADYYGSDVNFLSKMLLP